QGQEERPVRAPGRQAQAPDPARQAREVSEAATTLGLLAGGRATRLGGLDKAWLQRGGIPQVVRLAGRVRDEVDAVLVSANRDPGRYREHGFVPVADRHPGLGPLAGLDALAAACTTPW